MASHATLVTSSAQPLPDCAVWGESHARMLGSLRSNDASKRKRVNRTAKLKQWKRDARREQWLSHGKQDKLYGKPVGGGAFFAEKIKNDPGEVVDPESENHSLDRNCIMSQVCRQIERIPANSSEQEGRTVRSHVRVKRAENDAGSVEGLSKEERLEASKTDFGNLNTSRMNCLSDCSEADSSPKSYGEKSPKSKVTKLEMDFGSKTAQINSKQGDKHVDGKANRGDETVSWSNSDLNANLSGGAISSAACCAFTTDEEVHCHHSEDDDWEAVADALDIQPPSVAKCPSVGSSTNGKSLRSNHEVLDKQSVSISPSKVSYDARCRSSKPDLNRKTNTHTVKLRSSSGRAWRPDDTSRPSSLPRLKKQQSLPTDHVSQTWDPAPKGAWVSPSAPTHCPICIEEFDSTDSSFTPCICGFQLCLFCHHRILLEDGRCPGCRKAYDTHLVEQLAHSVNA